MNVSVPLYVTALVLAACVAIALAIAITLRRARDRAAAQTRVPEAVGAVLFIWLAGTTALAAAGIYLPASREAIPLVGIPLVIGLAAGWIATTTLPSLRALIDQPTTQETLMTLQVWRVAGFSFLTLHTLGQLPPLFALPAGLGDIAVGLAAPFVARRLHQPGGRSLALAWNVVGLLDLVVAVSLGIMTAPGVLQVFNTDPSSVAITAFPMALVPTFAVPLSMVLHINSFRYLFGARTAPAGTRVAPARHLASWR